VGAEKVSTELAVPGAVRLTVEGLIETLSPVGDTTAASVTLPENFTRLERLIVEVTAGEDTSMLREAGETFMMKSLMINLTTTV
jgi:hypothetical protein